MRIPFSVARNSRRGGGAVRAAGNISGIILRTVEIVRFFHPARNRTNQAVQGITYHTRLELIHVLPREKCITSARARYTVSGRNCLICAIPKNIRQTRPCKVYNRVGTQSHRAGISRRGYCRKYIDSISKYLVSLVAPLPKPGSCTNCTACILAHKPVCWQSRYWTVQPLQHIGNSRSKRDQIAL